MIYIYIFSVDIYNICIRSRDENLYPGYACTDATPGAFVTFGEKRDGKVLLPQFNSV